MCDGPLSLGGSSADFGEPSTATVPEVALEHFLREEGFQLPATGYLRTFETASRVLFTHAAEGASKVAVIVVDTSVRPSEHGLDEGWVVETFASCDAAEFAPAVDAQLDRTIWTDAQGNRVSTRAIVSFPGPEHCNWQSVTFLHLGDEQYLRDPAGHLDEMTAGPYDPAAALPTDAVDTGYRRGSDELWLAADKLIAFVVTDRAVEAWPSTTGLVGCM